MATQAIVVGEYGGPEVLELSPTEVRLPGPGEIRVDVEAVGVNFKDIYQRTGVSAPEVPFVPGLEGAGRVERLGEGVTALAVGQRVAWVDAPGSHAGQVVLPAERGIPVPDPVPTDVAAAALAQGVTAHFLTHSTYPVKAGESVLIHAAAGGTGLLLVQLAKHLGARVVATVSTEEKEKLACGAGADEVIRYDGLSSARTAAEVCRLTGGQGVDVVFDGVGAATFEASLASLRPRGMLVLFGAASGMVPPFDLQRLIAAGSLYVTRPVGAHYLATPGELRERADAVLGWIEQGVLDIRVGGRYPLGGAAEAHTDLASRRTTGKLLLIP
ncbi:zinc-binding dehydrogenase [Streptomyces sp. SID4928]|uniref:quinone oxidoreductase family protein n=1 Tax=unclassified Streptomyces TaxID=2593676 RepID=UPI0001C1A0C8|nr:quinone oxidoreductase [Streptomyces sp. ACT-1]EGE40300.1 NADPH:quinone reductase [Streptomyces sp. ACT-1]MYR48383.1 zinc-binding dehydrogenase [Streptomyces sp. SID4928]